LLAGQAMHHSMTLITANTREFPESKALSGKIGQNDFALIWSGCPSDLKV
jgi:hypothetical protein